ncbi:hypothetical protein [Plantactinospora sp. BC1]|nr:hypothetical protein [Plantactinospora sp. BC1]
MIATRVDPLRDATGMPSGEATVDLRLGAEDLAELTREDGAGRDPAE